MATGLLKVTITSGARRVDLVLPGAVPLAELVPELARSVGMLDVATVHEGYRVVTSDGRELAIDRGLLQQGVVAGGVLSVVAGVDRPTPRVYDDVVEAMADAVEQGLRPWSPAAGRRAALVAAATLLAVGLAALLMAHAGTGAGLAAALVAAALVLGGVVRSRSRSGAGEGAALASAGTAYAAGAGLMLVDHPPLLGLPLAVAGAAAASAGMVALAGLDRHRVLALPGVVAGGVALFVGLLVHLAQLSAAVVLTTLLASAVAVGELLPWLALAATGTDVDLLREPEEVDRDRVRDDARIAHEILVALSATLGAVLVLVAPVAVAHGLPATLLALDAAAVIALGTRRHRVGAEVLVGLGSSLLGTVAIAVSVLVLHPAWRSALAVALVTGGGLLLLGTLVPAGPAGHTLRRDRAADMLETATRLLLLPLAVLASGALEWISLSMGGADLR